MSEWQDFPLLSEEGWLRTKGVGAPSSPPSRGGVPERMQEMMYELDRRHNHPAAAAGTPP